MSSRSDLGRLTEGQTLYPVELTTAEAAALNTSQLVTVVPDQAGWKVTAQYTVGAVARGDLVVRVAPKIGAVQVLRLLAAADGAADLVIDPAHVGVENDADLTAVLARLFVAEAEVGLAAGPLRGYRTEDQTLPVLRGRLRIRDQYLRRFGQLQPLEVTVDEWTLDTPENQIIRSAALVLLGLPGLTPVVTTALRRVDRTLAEASVLVQGAPIPVWQQSRLNVRLHALLGLSELVLRHGGVESAAGQTSVPGFRVNMAHLFERLVARLVKEEDAAWTAQASLLLDDAGILTIKPDLVRDAGHGWSSVADTKYKVLDEAGKVSNADVYQLVTYCARLGLDHGHLIYADGGDAPANVEVSSAGVTLGIHRLDLSTSVKDLRLQVRELCLAMRESGDGNSMRSVTCGA